MADHTAVDPTPLYTQTVFELDDDPLAVVKLRALFERPSLFGGTAPGVPVPSAHEAFKPKSARAHGVALR